MIPWLLACAAPEPDVVLVTLDTTRADRLGAYGWTVPTPALDALAADGRRFDVAFSPIPLTVPAHASLFTGRYPPRLGIRGNGDAALAPGATTLAERLRDAGYTTAGFVGAVVTSRAFGFDQGFDVFDDDFPGEERPADRVVGAALAWEQETRDRREPRFVWVHLYDPHLPNRPTAAHPDPYDAAIAACDDAVGRLRAAFDRRPTWFVIAGDHGEGRGDHGEVAHGWYVYPSTQRVPWLMAGPGVAAGEVVRTPVSLVDLAPTLLDALGLPALPGADGRVVPGEPRPLYLESWQLAQRFGVAPNVAVVDEGHLLIDLPRPELYDLGADPQATTDRSGADPARVARMQAALKAFGFAAPTPASALDPELVLALAGLGYVGGGGVPAGPLPDPKDRCALLARAQQAELLAGERRYADAERLLAELVAEEPAIAELHARRAWVLLGLGRAEEATAALRSALALAPDDPRLQIGLGARLAAERRFDEAAALFRAAAEVTPDGARVRAMAVLALLDGGHPADAAALAEAWRDQHPEDLGVAGLSGVAWARQGRYGDALPLLEAGATAERPEPGVLFTLSAAVAGQGDRPRALRLLDRELALRPVATDALTARCAYHRGAGELDAMRALAARALALVPSDPGAWSCEAAALLDLGDSDGAQQAVERALAGADLPLARAVEAELKRRAEP